MTYDYSTKALQKKTMADLKAIAEQVGASRPAKYPNRKISWITQIQTAVDVKPGELISPCKPSIKSSAFTATDAYLLGREFVQRFIPSDSLLQESDEEKTIRERKKPILDQMAGATREEKDILSEQLFRLNRQLTAVREAREKELNQSFKKLLAAIKRQSGMSSATAKELAKQPVFALTVSKQNQRKVRKILADFYHLTGGRGSKSIKYFMFDSDRAYATEEGIVNIGIIPAKYVIFHEMAHHAEFESDALLEVTLNWRACQITGEPQRLVDLVPDAKLYQDDEMAYPGNFFDPYLGRVYIKEDGTQRSTEILSMGLQHFCSEDLMRSLYLKDKTFFCFLVGILASKSI